MKTSTEVLPAQFATKVSPQELGQIITLRKNLDLMVANDVTPSQFDVLVTLGDTHGMICSELSKQTLVTKGTLTGVLDRLVAKGLIRRDAIRKERRYTKVSLTANGEVLFRKTFASHVDFLRPFFERALSGQEVEQVCLSLGRLRDSFQKEMDVRTSRRRLV